MHKLCILPSIFFFLTGVFSCAVNQGALNAVESNYTKRKSNRHRSMFIFYDKKAIRQLRSDGIYKVELNEAGPLGSLCQYDTLTVKGKAIEIGYAVSRFMNHRQNHQYIDVQFTSSYKRSSADEEMNCYYLIRMPVDSIP